MSHILWWPVRPTSSVQPISVSRAKRARSSATANCGAGMGLALRTRHRQGHWARAEVGMTSDLGTTSDFAKPRTLTLVEVIR
jgi:hypothetical protein